jgi:putative SOS response-associated peptidase YedK
MCGRYTLIRLNDILERFPWMERGLADLKPRYNVAPRQFMPVIRVNSAGETVAESMRWGLIPHWVKGKPKSEPINARSESAATSAMFRQAMEKRRCLVPSDGFYEWQGAKPPKVPFRIHMKDDKPFAFAGMWERWRESEDAKPLDTFTILTTEPNELMRPIHNRMPVILKPSDYAKWLEPGRPAKEVTDLLKPYDADAMDAYPVSTLVNSPRNDVANCVTRAPDT